MNLVKLIKNFFSLFIISGFLLMQSCNDSNDDYIPYVPVDFSIDLNTFNELTTTGYSEKYEHDGYNGVIVFCEYYDVVNPYNSIYHAYDAACTFEISDSCSIINNDNNVMAECPCCETKYSLFDGYPISGSATIPLKYYYVSLINNRLYISNQ